MTQYQELWEKIKLERSVSFLDNAVIELQEYFNNYDKEKIQNRLFDSEKILAEEWHEFFRDKEL